MTAKHLFTICAALSLTLTSARAQLTGGIRGGLNVNRFYHNISGRPGSINTLGSLPGFHAGVYARLPITRNATFSPELLFSRRGMSDIVFTHDMPVFIHTHKLKTNYLELPLLFTYRIYKGLHAEAGPDVSVLLSSRVLINGNKLPRTNNDLARFDVGINAGLRFYVLNRLFLTARYRAGMQPVTQYYVTDISGTTGERGDAYNHSWMAGLGFALK